MTVFKTLSARIRGSKTELQELGEEEDEFTKSTSSLQGLVKGLTGFDIMKDKDTYKDIFDILVGIGDEWQNLTDIERASLGEALAGKRNSNALFAVLNNIDLLKEAYMTAENAAGSAAREEEHYEKSVEYRINQAKASLQELMYDFMSSDFLVDAISAANTFLQVIDSIVEHLGTFGSLFTGLGLLDLFKGFAGGESLLANFAKYLAGTGQTGTFAGDIKKVLGGVFSSGVTEEVAESAGKATGKVMAESATGAAASTVAASSRTVATHLVDSYGRPLRMAAQELGEEAGEELGEKVGEQTGKTMVKNMSTEVSSGASMLGAALSPMLIAGGIIAAGTAASYIAYTAYQEYKKKLIAEATKDANETTITRENIDAQISRIKDLREQLASGTLSEQESYAAKSELLSIQESLIGSYDSLAGSIDLVNGSLSRQEELLRSVSKTEAADFLNKNGEQIKNAENILASDVSQGFGLRTSTNMFGTSFTGISDKDEGFKDLKKLVDAYDSLDFSELGNGEYQISFKGDWYTADKDLNNFLTDLNELSAKSGGVLSEGVQKVYDDVQDYYSNVVTPIIEDNKPLVDQAKEHRLALTENGEQLKRDYEQAAKDYNSAIAGMGDKTIEEAETAFNKLDTQVSEFVSKNEYNKQFDSIFQGIHDSVNFDNIPLAKFKEQLTDTNSEYSKMAETLKKHDISAEDAFDILTGNGKKYLDFLSGIGDLEDFDVSQFEHLGNITAEDIEILETFASALGLPEKAAERTSDQISSLIDEMGIFGEGVKHELPDISDFYTKARKEIDRVDTLNSLLVKGLSSEGLSMGTFDETTQRWDGDIQSVIDSFGDIKNLDINTVLKRTSNGIKINQKAWRNLQAQQEKITKDGFLKKQKNLTNELAKAQHELKTAQDETDRKDAQFKIDSLKDQLQTLKLLEAEYDGQTSAYQKWLDAQNAAEEGSLYDTIRDNAIKRGDELYQAGLVGTKEFRAIANLFSDEDLTNAPLEDVIAAYQSMDQAIGDTGITARQFFTEGQEGTIKFAQALADLGFATGSIEDGFVFGEYTTAEIAKQLGISADLVDLIFGKIRDYGGDISIVNDDEILKMREMNQEVSDAKNKLHELEAQGRATKDNAPMDWSALDFNLSDLNTVEDLEAQKAAIEDLKINASPEAVEYLNQILSDIQTKIDILNGTYVSPQVQNLDSFKQAQEAVSTIQERLQEIQNIEDTYGIKLDIEGDEELQSAAQFISELPEEWLTKIGFTLDENGKISPEEVIRQVQHGLGESTIEISKAKISDVEDDSSGSPLVLKRPTEVGEVEDGAKGTSGEPLVLQRPTQTESAKELARDYYNTPTREKLDHGKPRYDNPFQANEDLIRAQREATKTYEDISEANRLAQKYYGTPTREKLDHGKSKYDNPFQANEALLEAQREATESYEEITEANKLAEKYYGTPTREKLDHGRPKYDNPFQANEELARAQRETAKVSDKVEDATKLSWTAFGGKVNNNLKKIQDTISNAVSDSQAVASEASEKIASAGAQMGASVSSGLSTSVPSQPQKTESQNTVTNTTINKVKTVTEAVTAAPSKIEDAVQHVKQVIDEADIQTEYEGTMHIANEIDPIPQPEDQTRTIHNNVDPIPNPGDAVQNVVRRVVADVSTVLPVAVQGVRRQIISDVSTTVASAVQYVVRHVIGGGHLKGSVVQGGAFASGSLQKQKKLEEAIDNPANQTDKTETALTGELGQELVVNGNRWWTVGDNGAEFTTIPKGSVVFDAEQTKKLLNKGYINSRGKAYMSGTAYGAGNVGAYGAQYINQSYKNNSPAPAAAQSVASSAASTAKSAASTASSTEKASEKADEFKETLDEIEILLDRVDRQIEHIDKSAQAAYNTFATRNNSILTELDLITQQIKNQEDAYNRYLAQANSVGLDEGWAEKVRNGRINIEDVTDEDLWDKIESYREWYISCHLTRQRVMTILINCWETLRATTLQRRDETCSSVIG